ncbi:uncharacterized protein ACB058_019592 [Synchiropus picturatus]
MNLVKNSGMHPHLREDEAVVVENAIRLAIDSIVNVLFGVRSGRNRELQLMVADRDKEIQRLEGRLAEIEQELQVMRRQGCSCRLSGAQSSGERERQQSRLNQESNLTSGQQECDVPMSFGSFARPPSHVSSHSQESAPSLSPNRLVLERSCTPHMSENLYLQEPVSNLTSSPSNVIIKEEPCDAVLIKWEMTDERLGDHQEAAGTLRGDSSYVKKIPEKRCEAVQVESGSAEAELLRNKKKSTPMSELTEEAQRLKRAAWREASRRYYARKVARQQAAPRPTGPFQHLVSSQQYQPITLGESKRKRIHELPRDSQEHQREVWRAASRRYYAHKVARHQTTQQQYQTLLHNIAPSEETSEQNGGGTQCSSHNGGGGGGGLGGILCS